jgi:hypothetical protein
MWKYHWSLSTFVEEIKPMGCMHYFVAHFRQMQHSKESQASFLNDPYGYGFIF